MRSEEEQDMPVTAQEKVTPRSPRGPQSVPPRATVSQLDEKRKTRQRTEETIVGAATNETAAAATQTAEKDGPHNVSFAFRIGEDAKKRIAADAKEARISNPSIVARIAVEYFQGLPKTERIKIIREKSQEIIQPARLVVRESKSRVTGTTSRVLDAAHTDCQIHQKREDSGKRWIVECVDHRKHVFHEVRAEAIGSMFKPWEWCDKCKQKLIGPAK
jgi:hypothetical protein